MVILGILIMFAGLEEMKILAYQILILGAMFFGLGVVVISVGVLNNSIKKLLSEKVSRNKTEISDKDLLRLRDELTKS